MNKKMKKLINNPVLFMTDMIYKRTGFKISTQTSTKIKKERNINFKKSNSTKKLSFTLIINSNDKESVEKCIEVIKKTNYKSKDFNYLICPNVTQLANNIAPNINNAKGAEVFNKITGDYTIFISPSDTLTPNFLINMSDDIVSNNYPDIIFPNVKKGQYGKSTGDVGNTLSSHIKQNRNSISVKNFVFDKVYGAAFKTTEIVKTLSSLDANLFLDLDGIFLFYDFLERNKIKKIHISFKSHYLRNEDELSRIFSEKENNDTELYKKNFSDLVRFVQKDCPDELNDFKLRSCFYICMRYLKHGLTNASALDLLKDEEKIQFKNNLKLLLNHIGKEVIENFNISCSEMIKIGCLGLIDLSKNSSIVELLNYDENKKEVLLRYYHNNNPKIDFPTNKNNTFIYENKNVSHNVFDIPFAYEKRVWIGFDVNSYDREVKVHINDKIVKIRNIDRVISPSISLRSIEKAHNSKTPTFINSKRFENAWVLMDRDNQADDNAEHLYRYIQKNHPEIPIYFVIRQDSHDWKRLESINFNLIAYGSSTHEELLEACYIVISSHAAQFATDYFKDKRMSWKKFVFLQHGVIHNDQGVLFKPDWKKFDLFITSSTNEYMSIIGDRSTYKFTSKEAKLTGLPRHDKLLEQDVPIENIILIMPTWRPSLLGKVIEGTKRNLLDDFISSAYAVAWKKLLEDQTLLQLAKDNNYEIIFFPHANIQPYISQFTLPKEITIAAHSNSSIQNLFKRSKIMITDYSSVAFEMAYLNKPVCYFQFDEEEFFSKGHYNKGYFSYRENGFGPVVNTTDDVIGFIKDSIENNAKTQDVYNQRIDGFFPYRDGNNCQRTFNAILSLNNARNDEEIERCIINEALLNYTNGNHDRAISLFNELEIPYKNKSNDTLSDCIVNSYLDSLLETGDFDKVNDVIINHSIESLIINEKLNIYRNLLLDNSSPNDESDKSNESNLIIYFEKEKDAKISGCIHDKINSLITGCRSNKEQTFWSQLEHFAKEYIENNHTYCIQEYDSDDFLFKNNILFQSLYFNSLMHEKKWGKILALSNSSIILQGRTGITSLAYPYVFSLNYKKEKITNESDLNYVIERKEIKNDKINHIIKHWLLYIGMNESIANTINNNVQIINSIELYYYLRELCKSGNLISEKLILNNINIKEIPNSALDFLINFCIIRSYYHQAETILVELNLRLAPLIKEEHIEKLIKVRLMMKATNSTEKQL